MRSILGRPFGLAVLALFSMLAIAAAGGGPPAEAATASPSGVVFTATLSVTFTDAQTRNIASMSGTMTIDGFSGDLLAASLTINFPWLGSSCLLNNGTNNSLRTTFIIDSSAPCVHQPPYGVNGVRVYIVTLAPLTSPGNQSVNGTNGPFATSYYGNFGLGGSLRSGSITVAPAKSVKNLGRPCDVPGSPACGDPINIATGNLFEQVTDYETGGQNKMDFTRYYNSRGTATVFGSGLGLVWRSTYDRYLYIVPGSAVYAERADGQIVDFSLVGAVWTADRDVDLKLMQSGATWTLTDGNDTVETYTDLGTGKALLRSIRARNGYTRNLQYNSSNQLAAVTDSYGRSLKFTYLGGLLASVTTPGGLQISYFYTESSVGIYLLYEVVYSTNPQTSQIYLYENAPLSAALAEVIDENGNIFASWTYDSSGRATSSQHAGGADLTTVAYNDTDGSRTVTNALGEQTVYKFAISQGVPKVGEIDRLASAEIAAAARRFTYDANGYMASQTDWNGNRTAYANNSRGEPTAITEAAGTTLARTTSTAWLATFHLPTSITEPGRVTSFSYDAGGNLLKRSIAAGSLTRISAYTYNVTGEVLTLTDPRGAVTRLTYDKAGDVATVADALGRVTKFTGYDLDGRPLSLTDPNGLVTKLSYNIRGTPLSENIGGEVTSYAYDAALQLVRATQPDASYFLFAYDAAHRLTAVGDAAGNRIAYTLDAAGNVTKVQAYDAANKLRWLRSYGYDAASRLAREIGALGQTTSYSYDSDGNLTGAADPLKHAAVYGYDTLNRLAKAVDAAGGATGYGYDALDHLTAVVDPRNLKTSYGWDGLDDQTAVASPDSGTTARTFDAAGNVLTSTDARGLKTVYKYDAVNRPTEALYADGKIVAWQYDQGPYGIGHLTAMTDRSGSTAWSYDQHGRAVAVRQTIGGKTLTTAMRYDAVGRLAGVTYPSGAAITVAYDAAGRVSGLKSGTTALVGGVGYLPFGPAEAWTQGNGAAYSRTFDQDGRIAGIGLGSGTMTLSYDAANRITGISETGLPAKSFGYDALDRLTAYTSSGTARDLSLRPGRQPQQPRRQRLRRLHHRRRQQPARRQQGRRHAQPRL